MDVNIDHHFVFTREAAETIRSAPAHFQGPSGIALFLGLGDLVVLPGLESHTFVVIARKFTLGEGAVKVEYVLDLESHNPPPPPALRAV